MPNTISIADSSNTPVTVNTIDSQNLLIGEVQASPTTNTVLERLKVLHTDNTTALTTAIPAGTAIIGKVGIDQSTLGTSNAVQSIPGTTGGLTPYSFLSTGAVQAAQIKGSAGQVYSVEFFNVSAAAVYVRLYNQTGAPAGGDNANIIWRGVIPGATTGDGFVKSWPQGIAFGTGIGIRVTAAIADTDTTVLSANTVIGNVEYK